MMPSASSGQTTAPDTQMRVQTALAGLPIAVGWGQFRAPWNLLWYADFKATQQSAGGKGALGGGGKGGSGSYNYSASILGGLGEGPWNILNVWNNQTVQTPSSLGLTLFSGSYTQTAWSYLTSAYSSQADAYRGIAYAAVSNMALGSSAVLPNYNFECINTAFSNAISGKPDANPKDVFTDVLTNAHYGVGFPADHLDALTNYSNYCIAAGLVVSPILTGSADAANSFLGNLLDATNSEARMSGGILQIVPRGDQNLSANGASYTAPSAPEYDFDETDFITNGDSKPIKVTRKRASDQYNIVSVRFADRANAYNPNVVYASDDGAINQYGDRPLDTTDWNVFCDAGVAQLSANLLLGRQHYRNEYVFTVGRRYARLDCLDIVSISHAAQNITDEWVKITDIERNSDGTLTITAEDYLPGTGAAPLYGHQANTSITPNWNVSPGNVNAPVIFSPPYQLAQSRGPELWILASGASPNWGGYQVWISTDNASDYRLVDTVYGKARQGVLTAQLPAGSDPDTAHTLAVDLTESAGEMLSATMAAADAGQSLLFVDGELISYETATLTAANKYNITYLRRGLYGTLNSEHEIGAEFAVIDGNGELIYPFDKSQIGKTVYLKFLSFNIYRNALQDLADVSAVEVILGGAPTDYAPASISATATIKGIMLQWTNAGNVGVEAVEIWRSASSVFSGATHIADAPAYATSYTDNAVSSATQYWYWIRYRDVAGNVGTSFDPSNSGAGATSTTGQAGTNDLANASVTSAKLGAGSVGITAFDSSIIPVLEIASTSTSAPQNTYAVDASTGNLVRQIGAGMAHNWQSVLVAGIAGFGDITGQATTAQINDLAVTSQKLGPGAVSASKMLIGSTDNLILDGQVQDHSYWTAYPSGALTFGVGDAGLKSAGWLSWSGTGSGGLGAMGSPFQCSPGQQHYFSCEVIQTSSSGGTIEIDAFYYDVANTLLTAQTVASASPASGTYAAIAGSFTVPANAAFVRMLVYKNSSVSGQTYYMGSPTARLMYTGTLIVDGSLQAHNFGADSVTASKMLIGSTANLVLDSNCLDSAYWTPYGGGAAPTAGQNAGGNPFWITPNYVGGVTSSAGGFYSKPVQCTPGDSFYGSAAVYCNTGSHYLYIMEFNQAGANTYNTQLGGSTGTGGTFVTGSVTTRSDTVSVALLIFNGGSGAGDIFCGAPTLHKMYTGNLIVDGTITSHELDVDDARVAILSVGAVNAGNIIADNILVTGHLTYNAVTARAANSTGSVSVGNESGNYAVGSVTITTEQISPVILFIDSSLTYSNSGSYTSGSFGMYAERSDGKLLPITGGTFNFFSVSTSGTLNNQVTAEDPYCPVGTYTYTVYANLTAENPVGTPFGTGTSNYCDVNAQWWNR